MNKIKIHLSKEDILHMICNRFDVCIAEIEDGRAEITWENCDKVTASKQVNII